MFISKNKSLINRENKIDPTFNSGRELVSKTKYDVFISCKEESIEIAKTIKKGLHSRGRNIYLYEGIRGTYSIVAEYYAAIKNSKHYLILLSRNYFISGYCHDEIDKIFNIIPKNKLDVREVLSMYSFGESEYLYMDYVSELESIADELEMKSDHRAETARKDANLARKVWNLADGKKIQYKDAHASKKVISEIIKDISDKLESCLVRKAHSTPVVTRFVPGTSIVKIFLQTEHPLSGSVREWLERNIGYKDNDVWEFTRNEYLDVIVPKLEQICGKGCIPPLE